MMGNLKLDGTWCFAHLPRTVYLVGVYSVFARSANVVGARKSNLGGVRGVRVRGL